MIAPEKPRVYYVYQHLCQEGCGTLLETRRPPTDSYNSPGRCKKCRLRLRSRRRRARHRDRENAYNRAWTQKNRASRNATTRAYHARNRAHENERQCASRHRRGQGGIRADWERELQSHIQQLAMI